MVQHASFIEVMFEATDCVWSTCLPQDHKQGTPCMTDTLGAITEQNVLMMRDKNGMPVYYTWLTSGEFEIMRENNEEFLPALKAWLELLPWANLDCYEDHDVVVTQV